MTGFPIPSELANLFPSFQRQRCIGLPSHLLSLTIPLATDSLLLGSDMRTQYASLMPIAVICTVRFWVKKLHVWHLYEMEHYSDNIGLRTWEIADLTAEHQHPTDGLELMMQGMRDGWVIGQDDEPLFWVPIEHRNDVYVPPCRSVIKPLQISTILDFSNSRLGREWTECIDKEWLRELEEKEKEVGNLLE